MWVRLEKYEVLIGYLYGECALKEFSCDKQNQLRLRTFFLRKRGSGRPGLRSSWSGFKDWSPDYLLISTLLSIFTQNIGTHIRDELAFILAFVQVELGSHCQGQVPLITPLSKLRGHCRVRNNTMMGLFSSTRTHLPSLSPGDSSALWVIVDYNSPQSVSVPSIFLGVLSLSHCLWGPCMYSLFMGADIYTCKSTHRQAH